MRLLPARLLSASALSLVLSLAACGGGAKEESSLPSAVEPPPSEPGSSTTLSPEECTAQGGEVRGDIGDGKIACGEGEVELGRVMLGIEGSICCAPAPQ